jgi:hypothetical protein
MISSFLSVFLLLPATGPAGGTGDFEPTANYESRDVEGWTVRVNKGLLEREPDLAAEALQLIADQLRAIERKVPTAAVEKLRKIVIWVEEQEPNHPCMAYHPSAGWLSEHGMNPEKAGCVEVANARNFLDWCKIQPWMVFHELAHGYHHQFLDGGHGNTEVAKAWERAKEKGGYEEVLYQGGGRKRHYALTNPMEYFAEASEAYFGTNDFYPFVRVELNEHDPEGREVVRRMWGAD